MASDPGLMAVAMMSAIAGRSVSSAKPGHRDTATSPRIAQVMIFVDDLQQARAFYEGQLGIPVATDLSQELGMLIMRHKGCILTIHGGFASRPLAEERRIAITFAVDDIEAEVRRLRALSVPLLGGIEDTPVHRFQMMTDPSGNLVEIGEYEDHR